MIGVPNLNAWPEAPCRSPYAFKTRQELHKRDLGARLRSRAAKSAAPQVVLTREAGKNASMAKMLDNKQITWLELPLVEATAGPDRAKLEELLVKSKFSWIIITSPEAASVFLEGWRNAWKPQVRIAVVGEGTAKVIKDEHSPDLLDIAFTPTKADGKHLAAELPLDGSADSVILFPCSVKAGPAVQSGLEERGCNVLRIHTYDTLPVKSLDPTDLQLAIDASVVSIASPSAVKAWSQHTDSAGLESTKLACIGSTSAKAAQKLGYTRVFHTDTPGLPGFLETIQEALEDSH